MAISVSGTSVQLSVLGTLLSSLDLATGSTPLTKGFSKSLTNGTGTDQINEMWHAKRVLAASASENLDLAGGLTDAYGNILTFTKIKLIVIIADAGNTNDVVIGNHATAAFVGPFGAATHTIKVSPGQLMVISNFGAGWTVTPTTADMIKVLNSAGGSSVTYDVVIFGTV